jgi:hypothetical protein
VARLVRVQLQVPVCVRVTVGFEVEVSIRFFSWRQCELIVAMHVNFTDMVWRSRELATLTVELQIMGSRLGWEKKWFIGKGSLGEGLSVSQLYKVRYRFGWKKWFGMFDRRPTSGCKQDSKVEEWCLMLVAARHCKQDTQEAFPVVSNPSDDAGISSHGHLH